MCIRGGIGEDLSFSEAILERYHADVFAFDPTPKAIEYTKGHLLWENSHFHFQSIGLSNENSIEILHLPKNKDWVSGSLFMHKGVEKCGLAVPFKKVITIMKEEKHEKVDIIKLDIEGSEFDVVKDILETRVEFSELVLEIHDRFFKDGFKRLKNMVEELEQCGYELGAVSSTEETLTFIKK